jgi:hypothetical protein
MSVFVPSTAMAPIPNYPDRLASAKAAAEGEALGFRMFPLWPGTAKPATENWEMEASASADVLAPIGHCNLGLALGRVSDVFAVRVISEDGQAALDLLTDAETTWAVVFPNAEVWLLYRFPLKAPIERRPGFPGLIVLADGDMIPLSPSWTWEGFYRWAPGRNPCGPAIASDCLFAALFGQRRDQPPSPEDRAYALSAGMAWKVRQDLFDAAEALHKAEKRMQWQAIDRFLSKLVQCTRRADIPDQEVRDEWESNLRSAFDLQKEVREHGDKFFRDMTEQLSSGPTDDENGAG